LTRRQDRRLEDEMWRARSARTTSYERTLILIRESMPTRDDSPAQVFPGHGSCARIRRVVQPRRSSESTPDRSRGFPDYASVPLSTTLRLHPLLCQATQAPSLPWHGTEPLTLEWRNRSRLCMRHAPGQRPADSDRENSPDVTCLPECGHTTPCRPLLWPAGKLESGTFARDRARPCRTLSTPPAWSTRLLRGSIRDLSGRVATRAEYSAKPPD